jgi:hypothetical protein
MPLNDCVIDRVRDYTTRYEKRFGANWEAEVWKVVNAKYVCVTSLIDHIHNEAKRIFADTLFEDDYWISHDALSTWTSNAAKTHLDTCFGHRQVRCEAKFADAIGRHGGYVSAAALCKLPSFYRNSLPLLHLPVFHSCTFLYQNAESRSLRTHSVTHMLDKLLYRYGMYAGRQVGNSPENSPLDNNLFSTLMVGLRHNYCATYDLAADDPQKFKMGTPKEVANSMLRTWEHCPNESDISRDIHRFLPTQHRIIQARGTIVEEEDDRTGRRRMPKHAPHPDCSAALVADQGRHLQWLAEAGIAPQSAGAV